jgi:two-component system chemotaxis response regulator CheB
MVEKITVLIVDDAVLVRKIVSDVLAEDPAFAPSATASNGKLALQRLALRPPDIVVLDLEMPEMNGLETIDEIRKLTASVPIVMFSAFTEQGAQKTLEALARGANEYVTKPSGLDNLEMSKEHIRAELLPKLKALCHYKDEEENLNSESVLPSESFREDLPLLPMPKGPIAVIAIGVSTGGPNALSTVISMLPIDLPVPIFITQHMPPMFTRMLAERLSQTQRVPVHEANDGMLVQAGHAYLAPGGFHLEARREGNQIKTVLSDAPSENSCRPAVDVMLRSLCEVYGAKVLTLILTGMGQDGKRGCENVIARGGIVLAQDEATSTVWGMPGAVVQAGLAHAVLALDACAPKVSELLERQTDRHKLLLNVRQR